MFPRATTRLVRASPRSLTLPTMLALGAVLVVVLGMFAALLLTTRSLDASSKAGRRSTQMQQEAALLERTAVDLETGVRGFLITRDREYLQPYEQGRATLGTHVGRLVALAEPDERRQVLALRDGLSAYVHDYTEPLLRSAAPGDDAPPESPSAGERRPD